MPARVYPDCPCCGSSSSDGSRSGSASGSASASASDGSSSGSSSSSAGSILTACCPNVPLPTTFPGTYDQLAGAGSPASGTITFTYDDGTGAGAFLGEGWYSDTWNLGGGEVCTDDFYAVYRCVEGVFRLRVYANAGGTYQDYGYTGSGGVWTFTVPQGECTGAEQTITLPYGTDCEEIGGPLMAARPQFLAAAVGARNPVADRFPLPLCQYEGAVSEYAACGCEDKHLRYCENPYQGATDPDGRAVPDIDRMTRAYLPDWDIASCEKCLYKKAPDSPTSPGGVSDV